MFYGDIQFLNQIKKIYNLLKNTHMNIITFKVIVESMMALQHVAQHKNIAFQSFCNLIDTVYKDQHLQCLKRTLNYSDIVMVLLVQ